MNGKTPKMETGGGAKQPGIIEPNVTDAFQTEKHARTTHHWGFVECYFTAIIIIFYESTSIRVQYEIS